MVFANMINVSQLVKPAMIANMVNFVQIINVPQLVAVKILIVVMETDVFLKSVLLDAKKKEDMKNVPKVRNA